MTVQTGSDLYDVLAEKARTELAKVLSSVPPEMIDGVVTHPGVAWQALCREGTERDVDLIVIGSHGYGAIDRLLGTTASKVVKHADRSVLVVR